MPANSSERDWNAMHMEEALRRIAELSLEDPKIGPDLDVFLSEDQDLKCTGIEVSSASRMASDKPTEAKITALESQRCGLHRGRNHSHEDHVVDREFHSWHHLNLAHTTVPISKAMSIPAAKKCSGQRMGRVTTKLPAWATSQVEK